LRRGQRDDLITPREEERVGSDKQRAGPYLHVTASLC
jgi:hypothetical protein